MARGKAVGVAVSQNPDGDLKEESYGNSSSRYKFQRSDCLDY